MSTKKTTPAKKSSKTTSKKSGAKNNTATVSTNVTEIETKAVKVSKKRVSLDAKSLPISAFIAEFVGTFILAAVALVASGGAIPMGFALVAIVLAIGAISGAHVNPLITVGAWVTRRISGVRAIVRDLLPSPPGCLKACRPGTPGHPVQVRPLCGPDQQNTPPENRHQ